MFYILIVDYIIIALLVFIIISNNYESWETTSLPISNGCESPPPRALVY